MMHPVLNEEYLNEMAYAREELENAITNKLCAPIGMLRLAYASQFAIAKAQRDHDAQKLKTSDQTAGSSQPNTQIEPLSVADLDQAIEVCKNIKDNHPKITSPDLYQLAGVVAVKELGGPDIIFIPGRKDPSIPPDEECVPYGRKGQSELREFFKPMGLDDKDIVALCGGLKLARANAGVEESPQPIANAGAGGSPQPIANAGAGGSPQPANAGAGGSPKPIAIAGVEGSPHAQTTEPHFKSVRSYFKELHNRNSSKGISNEIDKALVDDKEFRQCVEIYAKDSEDQKAFFADYKKSHKSFADFKPHSWIEDHIPMAQRAVGVAVAAAVAILSFFYLFKRRRASKHSSQHPQ